MTRSPRFSYDVWYALGQGYGVEDIAIRLGHPPHEVRREIADLREAGTLRAALNLGGRK